MDLYFENYTDIDNVKQKIESDGYCVVKNVLSQSKLKKAKKGLWETFNYLSQNFDKPIKQNDEKSWRSIYNFYPLHSMLLQHWKIGHSQFVWDIRQNKKVAKVFSKIWNVPSKDLLVSFDGLSFHLPPEKTNRGWYKKNEWFHTDQAPNNKEFSCVQGMITLYDVNKGDATLRVLKGSNKYHKNFFESNNIKSNSDWYKLNNEQIQYFHNKNCCENRVLAKAGDLILWDSRTIHQGIEPIKERLNENFRSVVYVCMTPRSFSNEKQLEKKRKAFNDMRMTSHWPHKIKLFSKNPRTYGNELPDIPDLPLPTLTEFGKKLAGF